MSFLNKWKPGASGDSSKASKDAQKKKEDPAPELTPLERMLQTLGPARQDGSDKYFGFENFGNTCYCNSMVQALYYTVPFRQHVLNYPPVTPSDTPNSYGPKVNVVVRSPDDEGGANGKRPLTTAEAMARRKQINSGQIPAGQQIKPEDKPDTPEYKKKQAMLKGPIVELAQENPAAYGMDECTFTGLRDIFMTLVESTTRTGVLSPQRFLEIFKRDNENFRNSMHQDAHEFYGLVLNDVISNVEENARRILEKESERADSGLTASLESALGAVAMSTSNGVNSPGSGWVHDIFEGLLTSETKCLTCETASQRDETFLDLSIDLEEHSSVTSCLQRFSAEEMLCERNKFHCDHCGGLQEAEKRMKIKRLPKVLALHLKRFKYTEDFKSLQKLFHRVVYPYQLRMFHTTEDADDPDRLYELYAVIIHIGGNAYHGHYVSVIKTEDRGWLLFDDEMVEPVDKHYVRNFFGDKPGMACAYVLFYQETTIEKVRAEQEAEGLEEVRIASEKADVAQESGQPNGHPPDLKRQATATQAAPPDAEDQNAVANVDLTTTPPMPNLPVVPPVPNNKTNGHTPEAAIPETSKEHKRSKAEKEQEKKDAKAAEKARKLAEKEESKAKEKQRKDKEAQLRGARKAEADAHKKSLGEGKKSTTAEEEPKNKENNVPANITAPPTPSSHFSRSHKGSKSMSKRSFGFLGKDKVKRDSSEMATENGQNGDPGGSSNDHSKFKERFSFGLGRKKSSTVLH